MFESFLTDVSRSAMLFTSIDTGSCGKQILLRDGDVAASNYEPAGSDLDRMKLCQGRGYFTAADGTVFYYEQNAPTRKVVICGAGHVALQVIRILRMLSFDITVVEDRPQFAREAEAAGATRTLIGDFGANLRRIPSDPDLCYILMTRGHRYDMDCLSEVLQRPFRYAGMMSSKMRAKAAKEYMLEQGIDPAVFDRLHSPIGLSIGSRTPAEIAVSVAAEIIACTKDDLPAQEPELLDALKLPGEKVLSMIVRRKGPAPREIGTKMLVLRDGRTYGSIGGGCFEAEVKRRALEMMHLQETPLCMSVDLTPEGAADHDGMACGGVMEVYLERIAEA